MMLLTIPGHDTLAELEMLAGLAEKGWTAGYEFQPPEPPEDNRCVYISAYMQGLHARQEEASRD